MEIRHIRRGTGKPILLIHGIGGSWRSWQHGLSTRPLTTFIVQQFAETRRSFRVPTDENSIPFGVPFGRVRIIHPEVPSRVVPHSDFCNTTITR